MFRRFSSGCAAVCAACLVWVAVPTHADPQVAKEKPNPIDVAYDACMEKNSSTLGMISCARQAHEAWDKEMNKQYKYLLKSSNAKTGAKLKAAQRSWLAFQGKEENMRNEFYKRDGTMYRISNEVGAMRIVKDRALELGGYAADNRPL